MSRDFALVPTTYPTGAPLRWGSYTRISDDPFDVQRGVKRQGEDNAKAISARKGELVKEYRENDTSAWKKKRLTRQDPDGHEYAIYRVIRPRWHEALRDLRNGVIDALMVWDIDRLARDPRDLEDAIEVVQYYGKRVEGPTPGQIDLTTDSGITMARVLTAMNNKSSADTARRVKRAHREGAEKGYTPGGRRPFGYGPPAKDGGKVDVNKLHPEEAKYARKAAQRLVAGQPLGAVARYLNEQGMRTTVGNLWDSGALRQYFYKAYRLIGVRALRNVIVYNENGEPVRGKWTPLLDEKTFYEIQEILENNRAKQRQRQGRPGSRLFLLTGLMRCAECGGCMTGNTSQNGRTHNYVCRGRKQGFNHTLSITGNEEFEQTIIDLVAEKIRLEDLEVPEAVSWDGEERLREVRAEIKETLAALKAERITAGRAMAMIDILETQEKELAAQEKIHTTRVSRSRIAKTDEATFRNAPVGRQREVIGEYINFILVDRPTKANTGRRGGLDLDRIKIEWLED